MAEKKGPTLVEVAEQLGVGGKKATKSTLEALKSAGKVKDHRSMEAIRQKLADEQGEE